ncbi:MFS transporter [Ligilactobacillus salivarius]|uniref:MFS transporter n=1 Tax=Ligilactobacillus salivarius TaxID=1624 RepID=UPI00136DF4F7|nr:MFS transporter [Ligilactobacillus salivarius]MYY77471.1 multidrug efflux MFS transporter [Ligilactobacillus salivarius]
MEKEKISQQLSTQVNVKHPWLAMTSMLIGAFVGMLSETSLNIALPTLGKVFNVEPSSLQWLVTGYMLVIGIVLPFLSLISKWFTTRQIVIFALADFAIGALISGFANSFTVLLIGRLIQGIGTGLILNALVIMFAPAIGPTITGIILGALSWRDIFFIFTVLLVIGLLFAIFTLENVNKITRPHVDILSVLGSIIGFSSLVAGVSFASEAGWTSFKVLGLILVAIIVLALYAHRQLKLENPVLNLRVFSKVNFRTGAFLVMINFGIILSSMYLLPQFIQNAMLLPVAMTGIIMLPGGIINALVSAISGRLYDSIGAKIPATIGFFIALIGSIMFIFASEKSSVAYVITAHIVLMIGCPLAMSPSQTHGLNALQGPESADGSTIMNTLQQIVGAITTAIATSLLGIGEAVSHSSNKAISFTSGVHFGFYFTAFLTIIGLLLALTIKGKNKSQDIELH